MIAVIWFHWLLAMCYLPESVERPSNGARGHASTGRQETVSEPHDFRSCKMVAIVSSKRA